MSKSRGGLAAVFVFGAIFATTGYLVAFHLGKPMLDEARASEQWPTADGLIESSEVVRSRDSHGDTTFGANVVYRYTVGDREYQSSTISIGADVRSSSSSRAYQTASRYPQGKKVTVAYDPEHPEVATLEPGTSFASYGPYGGGLVFLGVGCLLLAVPVLKVLFALKPAGAATSGGNHGRQGP